LTITSVNDAPVSTTASSTTAEDTPVEIQLTATDADADALTFTVVTTPEHGTVSIMGSIATYTPEANYNGLDSFTFKASDGILDSNTAQVSISITGVNDAPTSTSDSKRMLKDTLLNIPLIANDIDGDTLTYSVVTAPEHGTVSITGSTATYTPEANYNGSDIFTFKVNDGTVDSNTASVTITIESVNDAPVSTTASATSAEDTSVEIALTATDMDGDTLTYSVVTAPEHGTVSITGSTATYTPEANYNGSDSFTFKASDGLVDSNTSSVNLTITSVNDAPVSTTASATTAEDSTGEIPLTATDADRDGLT